MPGARLAVAVHAGAHHDADPTYAALGLHVAQAGIGAAGPVRERYLVGGVDDPDVDAWRTEIGWPIARW